jgi:hypothetical protein
MRVLCNGAAGGSVYRLFGIEASFGLAIGSER